MTAVPLNNSTAKKLQSTDVSNIRPPAYLDGLAWRNFGSVNYGSALMLVTVTGGSQAVLTAAAVPRKPAIIQTRDPKTGMLRAIREDDDVARLLAAAPDMLAALTKTRDNLAGLSKSDDDIFAAMVRRLDAAITKAKPL